MELQNRRAKGLCFNCDERFIPDHCCKPPQFLLLLNEEGEQGSHDNQNHPDELMIIDPLDPIPEIDSTNTSPQTGE